jgi:N-acetylmuramoyl-L-alanine amidase
MFICEAIKLIIYSYIYPSTSSEPNILIQNFAYVLFLLSVAPQSSELRIVSRQEWSARPPLLPLVTLVTPVANVVILHTASKNCLSQYNCSALVRQIQDGHTNKKYDDIAYSFLVGGDGNVYEGRGWDTRGAFGYHYNNISIGVAFIGTFSSVAPNARQIHAGQQLIAKGVELGKVSPDYKLLAHRQIRDTESPGDAFYEILKTWPHWQEN